ncbi:hypothetical protein ACC754_40495, partial [Rhizobium johnstonii]
MHYWLVSMRGGEKVVEELCRMFPHADIFTLVCNRDRISDFLKTRNIRTSFLQKIPGAKLHYTKMSACGNMRHSSSTTLSPPRIEK